MHHKLHIADGRHLGKNEKNRYISAAVQQIAAKFGRVTHSDPLHHIGHKKYTLLKIQDGGRLPS